MLLRRVVESNAPPAEPVWPNRWSPLEHVPNAKQVHVPDLHLQPLLILRDRETHQSFDNQVTPGVLHARCEREEGLSNII